MNKENFELVLKTITENPACWDQTMWHCGTAHCFAGWAQILSGNVASPSTVRKVARIFLDLGQIEADYLFAPSRTLSDFNAFLIEGHAKTGYDSDGYNRAGYDSDGYNRAGYNRAGYDSDGYDCDEYDSDGYDCDGYNRAGYDCDGYDSEGYDRWGHNNEGYDRAGYNRAGYNSDGYNRDGEDIDDLDVNNKPRSI